MVTASFGVGSTTWADFQNAAFVACASRSAAIPLRIAPGVRRRRPDQSVLRLAFGLARFARDALLFFMFLFFMFFFFIFIVHLDQGLNLVMLFQYPVSRA